MQDSGEGINFNQITYGTDEAGRVYMKVVCAVLAIRYRQFFNR